jgi:hypothetical protein
MSLAITLATRRLDGTPVVPAYCRTAVSVLGGAAEVGRGTNEISAKLSQLKRARCRSTLPKSTRPPPRRPWKRRNRLTTRPARVARPNWTLLSRSEPADLRMATVSGTYAYRDRPGLDPRHSRPVLRSGAAGVRMSVGCGSSCGRRGRESRLPGISQPGRREIAFATAAVSPDRGQKTSSFQGRRSFVS